MGSQTDATYHIYYQVILIHAIILCNNRTFQLHENNVKTKWIIINNNHYDNQIYPAVYLHVTP